MNIDSQAYNYFHSKFKLYPSTKGWYRFNFPLDSAHQDISGGVNFQIGYVLDHRSGYKSTIINFIKEYEGLEYREAKNLLLNYSSHSNLGLIDYGYTYKKTAGAIQLPDGYKTLLEGEGILARRARKVIASRGFDIELLDSKGFGYVNNKNSEWFGYLIIPFKREGKLIYYIGRDFIGNLIKYKNPKCEDLGIGKSELLFNEDSLHIYDKIYVAEGWADAMTMGDNSVATLGWDYSAYQINAILKSSCKEIFIIPDKGKKERSELTFYEHSKKIALKLIGNKKVKILNTEKFEKKDANEIGKQPILDMFEKTPYFSYSNFMSI